MACRRERQAHLLGCPPATRQTDREPTTPRACWNWTQTPSRTGSTELPLHRPVWRGSLAGTAGRAHSAEHTTSTVPPAHPRMNSDLLTGHPTVRGRARRERADLPARRPEHQGTYGAAGRQTKLWINSSCRQRRQGACRPAPLDRRSPGPLGHRPRTERRGPARRPPVSLGSLRHPRIGAVTSNTDAKRSSRGVVAVSH
jgi:hypothetical protein